MNRILRKPASFINRTEVYNDFPHENIYLGVMIRNFRSTFNQNAKSPKRTNQI